MGDQTMRRIAEALVGQTIEKVAPHADGGIQLRLSKDGKCSMAVIAAGIYGVYMDEHKETQGTDETWMDFREMIGHVLMHTCEDIEQEVSLVPDDDPKLRQLGFRCESCGARWLISLTKMKASTHPWARAMLRPEHRQILAKHLEVGGFECPETVPETWFRFFRGEGPFPG